VKIVSETVAVVFVVVKNNYNNGSAFPVINFDEYRTSCLDWRTEKYNNNAKVMDKHGKTKKLHSVLVYTIPTNDKTECKTSFQNRDRNSVLNIKKLTKWYLEKGERIYNYRRDIKLPERNLEETLYNLNVFTFL